MQIEIISDAPPTSETKVALTIDSYKQLKSVTISVSGKILTLTDWIASVELRLSALGLDISQVQF